MNKIITNGVSSSTSTSYITASNPPTTDNAIVRWDGTTGRYIQNSNIILSDDGYLNKLESGTQYNLLWYNRTNNSTFIGTEIPAASIANFTNCDDTLVIGNAAPNIDGASNTIVIGSGAGINYTTQSNTICIGSPGSVLDVNTIRIGNTQTNCYIAGIYNTNVGFTNLVCVDTNGKLGSVVSADIIPVFASAFVSIPINLPVGLPSLSVNLSKVGKLVTCMIASWSYNFTTPAVDVQTAGDEIPTPFRPISNTMMPMLYKVNGVYDTGLVGSVIVTNAGAIILRRDLDGSPSEFTGDSGWSWSISLSWLTA